MIALFQGIFVHLDAGPIDLGLGRSPLLRRRRRRGVKHPDLDITWDHLVDEHVVLNGAGCGCPDPSAAGLGQVKLIVVVGEAILVIGVGLTLRVPSQLVLAV